MNIIKIITYDSCKQILNLQHTIEVNLCSTTPNRQSVSLSLIVHGPYIFWEVKQMGAFFLNDETYENNYTFFYIILEYDRPNLDRFLLRGPNIWLVWQEIVYRNLQRLRNHLNSIISIAICRLIHWNKTVLFKKSIIWYLTRDSIIFAIWSMTDIGR